MTSMSTQKPYASSSSSSSSSTSQGKYDVFLSFYGEDTRKNFTDHLYAALIQKGIIVYRDNENLEEGKPIAPELMKAIEESQYAIIILSKNYAFSKWCLNELVKILECMKEKGLKVRPIFYHVNPSDVGNQRESFEKAFLKHEEDRKVRIEQIQEWRTALKEVSKICGRHLVASPEAEDIEEITKSIFDELNHELSDDSEHLVGINSRVKEMMNLFSTMSDDVRFIGIWGMAGIGKTTLASAIYYRIYCQFEASSFICDIREKVETDKHGLVNLQKQLLSETLMVKEVNIWNHHDGIKVIKKRLQNKKVLIVLDDVDKDEQLKALARSPDWFGLGSMIIITSKDKHLLKRHHQGTTIFKVNGLDDDEALELFSWTVFKQTYPKKDFEDLSNGFVKYAKGLPIALKVLGSSLIDRSREVWEDYLHQLKEIPEGEILDKLEISYRGLNEVEKNLFLDIACFFKGAYKNRVVHIEGSGCKKNIETLKDKSLIIILGEKLRMHDLIQEMAWRVVRRESPQEPGRRSRLWLSKDVFHVLKENTGTEVVEGMVLNSPPHKEENLNDKAFSNMRSLRLLKISNVHLPEGLNFLSKKLRILEWHDYPLNSMPNNFQPDDLVELIMPHSHVKQLPEGFGNLAKLRLLDLSDSKDFVQTPNFNGLPILEVLIFQGCTSLYELHLPVGALNRLTLLNLKDCKNLESLPSKINLKSLEIFILSGCSTLEKFPDIGKNMTSLLELYLDGTAIEELPPSIEHLTGLSLLSLKDCKRLSRFPRVDLPSLKKLILSGCKFQPPKSWLSHGLSVIGAPYVLFTNYFFPTLGPFNQLLPWLSGLNLVSLDLSDCNLLDGALPDDLTCLSSLKYLNLRKNNFTRLPDSMSQLSKLLDLNLNDCSKLQSLPNLPLSIGYVKARRCTSLENYSNQQLIRWTSRERGLAFVDYRSDKPENDFEFEVLTLMQVGLSEMFKRYPEGYHQRHTGTAFLVFSGLTEIPEWFSHQSPAGSSVKIPLSSNLCDNNSWTGIAFFAISVPPKNLKEDIFHGKELLLSLKTTYHSDMVGGLENCPQYTYPLKMSNVYRNISFEYGSYIPARELIDYIDEYSFITVSITSNHPHLDFKCGARKVHVDDLTEFDRIINNPHLGSSTEDHSVVSCQRYSTQKESLESLLLGLYQGDWAKNHKYDYIIPYITVPAWFHYHRFCSNIRIGLCGNLRYVEDERFFFDKHIEDERWMGIAVCAYYTVEKQLAGYDDHKDLTSFLCFYNPLPNHQIRLTRHKVFQDSEDIFVDSKHRILVYYIPRTSLPLRECTHIGASFEPKNPGVQVKECGIHFVFEHNVEEFVRTLVQCMLRCPDAYREFFYHNLLSHQYERESCFDNGKDNGCSSSPQRMRQPMPNIAEHCTSPESFSNPQIDVGTSRNFSPSVTGCFIPTWKAQHGSIMSSESSIKACLQKNCEDGELLHGYSAEREIPQWFCNQTNGHAVALPQPQELCNEPDLMGLALCGLFHFTKHPTAVRKNLDSRRFSTFQFKCFLQTNFSRMRPVCNGIITEHNELVSLIQRAFIWVLFIPYMALSHLWSQSTWFDFSFGSDSPDLCVESCGINLVYRQDMEELTRIMARCSSTAPFDGLYAGDPERVYKLWDQFPEIFIEATSSSEYLHPQRLFISQGETSGTAQYSYEDDPYPDNQFRYFHLSTPYDFCFPTRGTLKWFNHQSRGHSISLDITSNLYDDSNWMGLALYASFSIDRDGTNFKNMVSISSPHFLYCQFELSSASLDQIHYYRTDKEEKLWLCIQYGFSWISYIPGEAFKDMLNQCDHMKVSFVSDLPGVIVQKCGLRLLYQHDELQFERELQRCNTLMSPYQDFKRWLLKKETVHHVVDTISERTETSGVNAKTEQLDLDGCFEYFGCFPLVNVLPSFSSQSNEPSVTIYVPKYFYNDIDWMGLVLCAKFSIQEHQTAILENPKSKISHHIICLLETDVAGPEHLLVHHTNNEEFLWLDIEGQFLWLSCISRGLFPDEFNQCGYIKASIISDWPGVMVQQCGLSFFHVDDDWFQNMRFHCKKEYISQIFTNQMTAGKLKMKQDHDDETGPRRTSSSNEDQIHHEITRRPVDEGETSEAKDQHSQSNLLDFDHHLVHNFCFPIFENLGRFSNQSDLPSLTINSIRNLCSDNTWIGFALNAFFELNEYQNSILDILDSETSYNLICHLETDIGRVKPSHIYWPTKKDLMLLQQGGFFWLSYIPRGSLPDWLNHCILAKFSIATNCPGLTAQKFGLLPLFKHTGQKCCQDSSNKLCDREFKEILTCHVKSLSDNWNFIWRLTIGNTNRRQKRDNDARRIISGSSNDFKCGARKVQEKDLTELEQVISNDYLHLGSSTKDHSVVSCQRYSKLKEILESLLLGLYQGDWAKNHKYDYIIPYITVPAWFRNHRFCSNIRIGLPGILDYFDERWMGIAVCAYYTVDKQLAGYDDHKDLTSFLCFYNPLPNHQTRLTRHKVFQDSEDIFVDSKHRILVYYIPRTSLRLRECTHIGASFEPKNPGVQVKECGIQLVFEQNVEEFVRTLVQCMLRCPDAYHEFFYHNLLSHQYERESCFDNGKDNGCSSSSQRPTFTGNDFVIVYDCIIYPIFKIFFKQQISREPCFDNGKDNGCSSSSQRMRQPMPNIAEHCTSPESFSNPQIHVGTSRNFSPSVTGCLIPTRKAQHGSIMSSESSIKACLQKNCEVGEILHGYSGGREIPQWFCSQTFGNSVELWQPQELCNDPDLMGLALCGLFHFTKHPTAVRKNLDLRTCNHFRLQCFLKTSSSPRRSVCNGLMCDFNGFNELISLIQLSFIWVLFIPYTAHSHLWSQSTWFDFSFTSSSADLYATNCAINLVYRQNMEELTRIMARYSRTATFDRFLIDNTHDPETVYDMWDNFPEIFIEATSSSEYLHPQRLFISQGETSGTAQYSHEDDPYPDNQFRYFHPSTPYDFCFPTRGTLKWFNHQSRGHSISLDITSNLYDDSNWMGLALYASFYIDGDGTNFENMDSISSPHFLYCQFELSNASLDQIHSCRIDNEEKEWLWNQFGFSWISYMPGEAFKDMLNQCDHMKASFVSDLPGVIVQKCGLRLLYQHDELQFERELQHCSTSMSRYQDFKRWLLNKKTVDYDVDTISERTETTGMIAETIEVPIKQLDLDGCFEYFGCFPLVNVLPSFSSQSNEPSVTIYVPKYFYNDIDWMGLVLCAEFSIQDHQTAILENPKSKISHHIICLLETDVAGPEHLFVHHTNNEELLWLDTEGQFLWLSCISRGLLPDEFNQCGYIKASIISDWPGVMVQKCGLSFFHVDDDWFQNMRVHCRKEYISQNFTNQMTAGKLKKKQDHDDETGPRRTSSSNEDQIHHEITRRPIDKGETSEAKDQHSQSNLLDFDHHLVHNFCFPVCNFLAWFSNQSDSPSLTINSIRNLCSDNTWIGFALFAFFELNENQNSILDVLDSETSYNLTCHLETNIGSVKPCHIYCPTKKDLMLSQTGGFFWLSYIPRRSLPDWLNHCILAKFSFATNCPGLTAQKCGLRPLYRHNGQKCSHGSLFKHCEEVFKGGLQLQVKFLSDNWNMIWKLTIDNTNRRQKHETEARPSTSGSDLRSHPEIRTKHGKKVLE